MIDNKGKVNVGAPAISGAKVTAKELDHVKGDKVVVFKRKKGYRVKMASPLSLKLKLSIVEKGATAKKATAAAKKEAKAETKAAAKKAPAAR